MKKPNFFIVGAAKSGTTALHAILSNHPEIYFSPVKEPNYFSEDISISDFREDRKKKFIGNKIQRNEKGEIIACHQMYVRDSNQYTDLFAAAQEENTILGEASVSYLYSRVAAENIYSFNKDAKILIILREPVKRAFSHYLMNLKTGDTDINDFLKAVEQDYSNTMSRWENEHLYVELGQYYNQVKRYLDIFPSKNLLILKYEDFKSHNFETIAAITNFLDIANFDNFTEVKKNVASVPKNLIARKILSSSKIGEVSKIFPQNFKYVIRKRLLTSKNIPELSQVEFAELKKHFEEDVARLNELLSNKFANWLELYGANTKK